IEFSNGESVLSASHRVESLLSLGGDFAAGHEHAVGLVRAASNSPPQLMKLREAKALGMLDNHHGRVRYIDTNLDDGCCDEDVDFVTLKACHREFLLVG